MSEPVVTVSPLALLDIPPSTLMLIIETQAGMMSVHSPGAAGIIRIIVRRAASGVQGVRQDYRLDTLLAFNEGT